MTDKSTLGVLVWDDVPTKCPEGSQRVGLRLFAMLCKLTDMSEVVESKVDEHLHIIHLQYIA